MRIAVVQMNSRQSPDDNLEFVEQALSDAESAGAGMVFLPENFAAFANPGVREIADRESGSEPPVRSFLAAESRKKKLWIIAGTIPVAHRPDGSNVPDGRVRAACYVYSNAGIEVARYDKLHLFDVIVDDATRSYRESAVFEAGNKTEVIDTPAGCLGLSVCYDIRFPELYRQLLYKGAQVFSIPSAFTQVTGKAHWLALARARAIENFAYVVGACQWGKHDSGRETWGESLVVDPWGNVVGRHEPGTGVLVTELDMSAVSKARRDIPVHRQGRMVIKDPCAD